MPQTTWNALTAFLTKKGFTRQELLQGGLAGQKQGRDSIYDLFRGRIMFTISDREGRPIGFTGRVLGDEVPKYLNTPQTPLYDKSQVIYGFHLAKEAIRSQNRGGFGRRQHGRLRHPTRQECAKWWQPVGPRLTLDNCGR